MGSMTATICAVYAAHGLGQNVAVGAAITLFVFVGLTIFVQMSDIDFSFMGLFLPVCLLVLIFWMMALVIFGFSGGLLLGGIGVLLFSAFIIYDTCVLYTYIHMIYMYIYMYIYTYIHIDIYAPWRHRRPHLLRFRHL